ncbi:unnamed protein product [Prunus brigantina]
MQQLLLVVIRSVVEKPARYAITRLCFFFNAICAKTVDVSKLDKLEEDNRTHPEGCIAERYIAEEVVEFCTEHLSDVVQLECHQARRWDFQSSYQVAQ